MARLAGIDLPRNKRIEVALTYIFGIGRPSARKLLAETKVNPNTRTDALTEPDLKKLRDAIEVRAEKGQKVEGDLRRDVSMHIKRLIDLQSYRGMRHRKGLPVRGQRTHTNARTRKGPRKGSAAMRKTE